MGSFPVSAHFPCFLHRVSLQRPHRVPGVLCILYLFASLFSFDLFPFRALKKMEAHLGDRDSGISLGLGRLASSYHILQHNISLQQMRLSLSINPNSQLSAPTSRVPQLPAQLHSTPAHRRLITTEAPHFFFPVNQGSAGKCR